MNSLTRVLLKVSMRPLVAGETKGLHGDETKKRHGFKAREVWES